MFGVGKATALNVMIGGHHLIELGEQGADEDTLIYEATTNVAACYGSKVEGDMSTHRHQMWKSKILDPILYDAGVSVAPLTILHLIMCG